MVNSPGDFFPTQRTRIGRGASSNSPCADEQGYSSPPSYCPWSTIAAVYNTSYNSKETTGKEEENEGGGPLFSKPLKE